MRMVILASILTAVLALPAAAQVPAVVPEVGLGPAAAEPVELLTPEEVQALLDTTALTTGGREVGTIDNLLIYPDGEVAAVVLEWGGALGLGERQAVVPWDEVALAPERDAVLVDLSRERLEELPQYDPDVPAAAGVDPDIRPVR